ncbi:unnamed protein product [Chondrus crispus]|uniref:Uncharacterized protein n=1 Tax=Chondrus crispus TaxID=2769 RepID=R7Q7D8_CHOCR|nr:unnamed protein product [Chondrus crispus]CDF33934.1 unnamed protein product [Chondrus crispus]|eukprot:XP_005713753.1 unnamed protein product [Chondrus crispus]
MYWSPLSKTMLFLQVPCVTLKDRLLIGILAVFSQRQSAKKCTRADSLPRVYTEEICFPCDRKEPR